MEARRLTLGHSPDPDDAFMFYALAKGLVSTRGYQFEHILEDIQTLNERARRGELDITAVSFHAYAHVSERYVLLPVGASMGEGYGPILVAKERMTRDELAKRTIAIPGVMTSAFLALQLWLGRPAAGLSLAVVPFDRVFAAVKEGIADAGLVIHEGQLTWEQEGLALCGDLGAWWWEETGGLPLPLGGNVIHRRIPRAERALIADILKDSVQYGLDHREEAVRHALRYGRGLTLEMADRFVGMYVNRWTLGYSEASRKSISRFLSLAWERGLLPRKVELEFVD